MRHSFGQVATESFLLYSLIGVTAIGGLTLLGNDLSNAHEDTANQITNAKGLYKLLDVKDKSTTATNPDTSSETTPSSTGNVQIVTANGTTINLEGYSPLFSESIETTGANGTTLSLYSSLMNIAQELESAGEVDATQANLLRDLANQGHRLAEIEGLIETAAQQASSVFDYNSVDIPFDGQTYKTFELEALLGWSANGSATPENIASNSLNATGASPETATFIALYESVLASGALDDPAVMDIVTGLSGEIAYLTELTEHASALVGREEKPLSEFNSTMVSETTHYDSELICNEGDGAEDTGVSCP